MNWILMPPLNDVEINITKHVVQTYLNSGAASPRIFLVKHFKNLNALDRLIRGNVLNIVGNQDAYLPKVLAFYYCGDPQALHRAKAALTQLLQVIQDLFYTSSEKNDFTPKEIYDRGQKIFSLPPTADELKLGLHFLQEFGVAAPLISSSESREVTSVRVSESIVNLKSPETAWDDHVTQYKQYIESDPAPIFTAYDQELSTASIIKVFISHSSADVDIAKALIELLRDAIPDLHPTAIRCTSVPGYKLPGGSNTDTQLRQEMRDARIFIGLLTEQSLASTYVLFELGARWGTDSRFTPLIAAGLRMSELKSPLNGMHAHSCETATDLQQMLVEIAEWLGLKIVGPNVYDGHLRTLVELSVLEGKRRLEDVVKVKTQHLEESAVVNEQDLFKQAGQKILSKISPEARKLLLEASEDPQGGARQTETFGGLGIEANGKQLIPDKYPRTEARWRAAVVELVDCNLLEDRGGHHEIFTVTKRGYEIADSLRRVAGPP